MRSRLQLGGHPIHAMVVAYPIGLYTTSVVCDLLYLVLGEAFWFRMAYWAILFGLLTHVVAALTGLPDFLAVMRERDSHIAEPDVQAARRAASSHLVFGTSLLVVQGLNLALRNGGEIGGVTIAVPVIINVVGLMLVGVQGWYGGELVYRYFVGVDLSESRSDTLPGKHKPKKHH